MRSYDLWGQNNPSWDRSDVYEALSSIESKYASQSSFTCIKHLHASRVFSLKLAPTHCFTLLMITPWENIYSHLTDGEQSPRETP